MNVQQWERERGALVTKPKQFYMNSAPTEPGDDSKLNFPAPNPFPALILLLSLSVTAATISLCLLLTAQADFHTSQALMDTAPGWGWGDRGANLRACYRQFLSFSLCLCLISGL